MYKGYLKMALDFPSNPIDGQTYGNYQWSSASNAWKSVASVPQIAVASSVAPSNPTNGSIWFNTNDGVYFSYYDDGTSSQWVEMMSSGIPASPVTVANGGTGTNSLTSGGYLKGAGTSAITSQTGIPTSDITSGVLPIARGGTGVALGSGLVPIVPTVVVGSGSYTTSTSGLVTVTNASTVQFRSVFNSTYKNYRIVYRGIASGNLSFTMNLMSGTTVDTTTNYKYSTSWFGSRGNNSSSNTAGGSFGGYFGHNRQSWSGDLFAPNLAHRTHLAGMGHAVADSDGATELHIDGGTYAADTVFDGIQFAISTGSFQSATFQLYGYIE